MAGEATMEEATISEEMIVEMRKKVGAQLRIDHSVFNEEATRLAILKFAGGIGDANPLWCEPAYGERTCYGCQVAPPSFVIGCFSGLQFGWPGLGSFHSESDLEFRVPVLRDDVIRASCLYEGFDGPKPSNFAPRFVIDRFLNRYENQRGELVATIRWAVINFERGAAKQRGSATSGSSLPHRWSAEEAAAVDAEVLAQAPRGAVSRWFEDVREGDELAPLTKGPVGLTDEIAFVAGGGAPIPRLMAHRSALLAYEKHRAWAFRDPTTMALEPIYSVNYNRSAANAMAVPEAYDVGFQRQCWHLQLLTNWMGDDGWIRRASAQYRKFVYHADVVRLGGKVLRKFVSEDGEACVELATWARNQRGEDVMPGNATLALPSRERGGASPAARRVRTRAEA